MTQISFPWTGNSPGDAGAYSADYYTDLFNYLENSYNSSTNENATGYIYGTGESSANPSLAVREQNPVTLGVTVKPGWALIRGKWYNTDADVNQSISSNTSGSTRYDVICLELDYNAQTIRVAKVQGTPGAGVPALTDNPGTLVQVSIAEVEVAAAAPNITDADITPTLSPLVRNNEAVRELPNADGIGNLSNKWVDLNYQTFPILALQRNDKRALHILTSNDSYNYAFTAGAVPSTDLPTNNDTSTSTSFVTVSSESFTARDNFFDLNLYWDFSIEDDQENVGIGELYVQVGGSTVRLIKANVVRPNQTDIPDKIINTYSVNERIECSPGDSISYYIQHRCADGVGTGEGVRSYTRGTIYY